MTSSEAIIEVLTGPKAPKTAVEITKAGFPLTTRLKGEDPRHTFYMNLYKEAKRPTGSSSDTRARTARRCSS